ncbi:MAG: MFS transporter [Candidatus Viridilinea halotolerans]|uniref:MFS transporter n=1 Tax=Candidatus Viridilinea halotolerans TaxID=2491704 RepID=A0A426TXT7_9CHLR|nr:MAG: MFS transporter [Candidatus Viridilinea halotolerans]
MTLFKNFRLGLLHVAVAITLVPISGVLNRIMIHEMGIWATIVAGLIILPPLLSPLQPILGQYSDHHPLFGYRRTPYIVLGFILCISGAMLTPLGALAMDESFFPGFFFALGAFFMWGLGYNLAVVSYLSLASDLSDEGRSSRTIAIMWFMMLCGVITTAILTGIALDDYSSEQLVRVFFIAGMVSFTLATLGIVGLEPRNAKKPTEKRHSFREAIGTVIGNPHARVFFVYLIMLLSAIMGQDVLLEPFGAAAFDMSVRETTQLTAFWGAATMVALLLQGVLFSRFMTKKTGATMGALIAVAGFFLIALSGVLAFQPLFVPGIIVLGFGTGIATTTNLAMMLDMTTPTNVGLYIGAWGVADATARGLGNVMAGVVRDIITHTVGSPVIGYTTVFMLEGTILCAALLLLRRIDVSAFRSEQQSMTTLIAVAADA